MFTGIIEESGKVAGLQKTSGAARITIKGDMVLQDAKLGDSIAVNGVCVTVTGIEEKQFQADISPETLKRTNLGELRQGASVNLERAMPLGGRFGGHIVSGHIDGTGIIKNRKEDENSIIFTIEAPWEIMKYTAFKGSVAIDGISLTVADCTMEEFSLAIIPFTLAHTTLNRKKTGDRVNIECDVLSKYVERLLLFSKEKKKSESSNISEKMLKEAGFF